MLFSFSVFLNGLGVGLGLIAAIGMQNVFVLKQGILKNRVLLMAVTCSLIDAILIIVGINGLGSLLAKHALLLKIFNWGGILFLFGYGTRAFFLSFKGQSFDLEGKPKVYSAKSMILTLLAVSLLNPHTYLDSCVLMASIATNFQGDERLSFTIGAILASFIWFFFLSFGARFLRGFFEDKKSWRILDFLVGCIMFTIAISLMVALK